MKNKAAKGKNLVHGNLVKKLNKNMKIYSKDEVVLKTDAKLTANDKKKKGDFDGKFKMKKDRV
jgi:hypothetical protein